MTGKRSCWCGGEVAPRLKEIDETHVVVSGVCVDSPEHDWRDVYPRDPAQRLYIAGPMTGYPDCNYPAFYEAQKTLTALGYLTVNPADSGNAASYRQILKADMLRLLECDGIALLPGWASSTGARAEVTIGMALQMDVRPVSWWPEQSSLGTRTALKPAKFCTCDTMEAWMV